MSKELVLKKFLDVSEGVEIVLRRSDKIRTPSDFANHQEGGDLYDAILMRLQVIGEVLKKIAKTNPEILKNHPGIEWNKIIGLRDVISHDYLFVDEEIIFSICKEKIPALREEVNLIIKDLEEELNNKLKS
ncbi:MAG: HepT-like ribonuclease domain-containing protein [Melioribacteraceae bacterium]